MYQPALPASVGFHLAVGSEFGASGAIVVGGEPLDGVATVSFATAIYFVHAFDASGLQFPAQIARGGHELGEDEDLVFLEHGVGL